MDRYTARMTLWGTTTRERMINETKEKLTNSVADSLSFEKIVNFWSRYDYNRLVDFYQTLEDSNDKDLVDFEIRNYSFRYNRTVHDKETPYNELPLVRRLAAAALMKCRDKVKHKKVYDLSGVFSYQN